MSSIIEHKFNLGDRVRPRCSDGSLGVIPGTIIGINIDITIEGPNIVYKVKHGNGEWCNFYSYLEHGLTLYVPIPEFETPHYFQD